MTLLRVVALTVALWHSTLTSPHTYLFPLHCQTHFSAFSKSIANVPIQIVAVTESGSASAFFSSDLSQQLIRDGNALADALQAHFMTSSTSAPQKS